MSLLNKQKIMSSNLVDDILAYWTQDYVSKSRSDIIKKNFFSAFLSLSRFLAKTP